MDPQLIISSFQLDTFQQTFSLVANKVLWNMIESIEVRSILQDDNPDNVEPKNMDKEERDLMRSFDPQEINIRLESSHSPNAISPLPTDCILGRGRAIEQNPGNMMFRSVIEQFRMVYADRQRRSDAQLVIGRVLDFLRHRMRFLYHSKKKNEWQLATQEKVRRKVGQYLRYLEKKELRYLERKESLVQAKN